MAGYTGFSDWGSLTNDVAGGYSFDAGKTTDGWSGFFGDALGAWVTVEGMKAKAEASGAAQDHTRTATSYPSGSAAPGGQAGGGGGGMAVNGQTLMVVGLLGLAAVMVLK